MIEFEPGELETKFFGPEGAERVEKFVKSFSSIKSLMAKTEAMLQDEKLLDNIAEIASYVEPLDRTVDLLDTECTAANTFLNGARVALGGLIQFSNRKQRAKLNTHRFMVPRTVAETTDDKYQLIHEIGTSIIDAGLHGFDVAVAYHDLYADIERDISEQVKYDLYGQAGFGLPFYLVREAIEAPKMAMLKLAHEEEMAQLEALKNTVNRLDEGETTIDWDASFAQLLGGPQES